MLWHHLRANGAAARSGIRDLIESPLGAKLVVEMDLAGSRALVTQYSRQRIGNYEHVSILAIKYDSGDIPQDNVLLADLRRMLTLLAVLYGDAVPQARATAQPGSAGEPNPVNVDPGRVHTVLARQGRGPSIHRPRTPRAISRASRPVPQDAHACLRN
jgi:hypothetical protein